MAYILVADDDDVLTEMLRQCLTRAGHEVRCVNDGEQLLDQVCLRRPDAILLDVRLPVLSGMETLVELKTHPAHMAIPVIVTTARRSHRDSLSAMRAGAAGYVTKPFSPEELALRIESVVTRRRIVTENGDRHSVH